MNKKFSFKLVRDQNEMFAAFDLIRQLTPELNINDYKNYLYEMTGKGYSQLLVFSNAENKLIGVCGIWIGTKIYCGKYLEMDNVVIDEKYRSKGIGKLLYEKVELIARANSCKVIMLDAYKDNLGAHKFYENEGFDAKGFHFIKKLG